MRQIPIYSVIGYSGTGKTTFLEKLIREFRARGISLAVVKHDAHRFEIDREGKDSWRFAQAGAQVVALVSQEKAAFIEQRDIGLQGALERIRDVELILTEGYKHEDCPKIAVYRAASGKGLAGQADDMFAIVTDTPLETAAPCFSLDDAAGVADLIERDMREKEGAASC